MIIYRNDGNAALEEAELWQPAENHPQNEPELVPSPKEPNKGPKPKTFRLTKKQKVKILSKILVVTALAFFLVARYAVVSQANLNQLDVKTQIKSQQTRNGDLEAKLSEATDFTTVQAEAASMRMDFPDNDQIEYIDVVPYEEIVARKQAEDQRKKETGVVWQNRE